MATFKPIAINRTGVNLPYAEGQFIVATQSFTNGSVSYPVGVYVDMLGARQQLTTQGPKGETGDTGATGATGQNGQAATIRIGSVTTGAPGSPAQVSNSGTEQNAVIDLVIPTGAAGPQGTQGAGWFHTMVPSGVTLQISSLQPQLAPSVGDVVFFPNGEVRQIISVSGSTVTLGNVLFSFKGDPGIGNALLSNTDGDSDTNGFTQKAVKGIAQAKNYYNLGAYDTYVSNGDGTATVTRETGRIDFREFLTLNLISSTGVFPANNIIGYVKTVLPIRIGEVVTEISCNNKYISAIETGYFPNTDTPYGEIYTNRSWANIDEFIKEMQGTIIEYKVSKGIYTEQVIENQPIHIANQEENLYWQSEWRKGLNLIDLSKVKSETLNGVSFTVADGRITISGTNSNSTSIILKLFTDLSKVKGKIITLSGKFSDDIFVEGFYLDSNNVPHYFNGENQPDGSQPIYIPNGAISIEVYCGLRSGASANNVTIYPMLNFGDHSYPYQPYCGGIVRQNELPLFITATGENPAETIGGDWEDKGTTTTSDGTVLHVYRRI